MGMAASQARYLALVARKSNCEYEGQQINQARLNLSNQSANLFNQMLGLNVPTPPSTQDFTKTQYSFTDGINAVTLDSWQQLATPEEDYNYVVNYHYNADVYTGSQKKMNDPQVQFSGAIPSSDKRTYTAQIAAIQAAQIEITDAQNDYDEKLAEYQSKLASASSLSTYADNKTYAYVTNCTAPTSGNNTYVVTKTTTTKSGDIEYLNYTGKYDGVENTNIYVYGSKYYIKNGDDFVEADNAKLDINSLKPVTQDYNFTQVTDENDIKNAINKLIEFGALNEGYDVTNIYRDSNGNFVFQSDLDALVSAGGKGTSTILPLYYPDNEPADSSFVSVATMTEELSNLKGLVDAAKIRLDLANATFDALSVPSYIGNCKLTPLSELGVNQMAEISQIIKDMKAQDVNTNLTKCFDTTNETYNEDTYSGGIYSFTLNGITYYTTYYDLAETITSGEGINHIDNQQKLPYYNASYVSTKIEKTEKALLETDSQGRFSSIRLGDDTIKYTLNVETITDDAAYQDAMNQYYYENAQYDKMIQDINAKTSLIQQEDQQLELRLKQLDTEQNALSQEMEAVQKVVKDNVEKSFKAFGG